MVRYIDIIHATISLEKKLIIITADNPGYDSFKKYDVLVVHINELLNIIQQFISEDKLISR